MPLPEQFHLLLHEPDHGDDEADLPDPTAVPEVRTVPGISPNPGCSSPGDSIHEHRTRVQFRGLFATMSTLWPHMVEFARKEQWDMPEFDEKVWADLHQLQRLAAAFVMAQKELESDEFGTGSLFTSHP
jgi:hypothetical protein